MRRNSNEFQLVSVKQMKRVLLGLLCIGFVISMDACKVVGGGKMISSLDGSRSTISFNMHNDNEIVKGQVQYKNNESGFKFHGIVDEGYSDATSAILFGTCIVDGLDYMFQLTILPNDENEDGNEIVEVYVSDESMILYADWGEMDNGNIQFFPDEIEE